MKTDVRRVLSYLNPDGHLVTVNDGPKPSGAETRIEGDEVGYTIVSWATKDGTYRQKSTFIPMHRVLLVEAFRTSQVTP